MEGKAAVCLYESRVDELLTEALEREPGSNAITL